MTNSTGVETFCQVSELLLDFRETKCFINLGHQKREVLRKKKKMGQVKKE